jgi:hypothetical protein
MNQSEGFSVSHTSLCRLRHQFIYVHTKLTARSGNKTIQLSAEKSSHEIHSKCKNKKFLLPSEVSKIFLFNSDLQFQFVAEKKTAEEDDILVKIFMNDVAF